MSQQRETCAQEWTQRPVFQRDQRLTPDRLNRIHQHQSKRLSQLILGLAGTGVVYGFALKTHGDTDSENNSSEHYGHCVCEQGKIYIGCGLAIDCYGRALYWHGGWVGIEDLGGALPECPGNHTLYVHYAERAYDVDQHCGCDESAVDWVEEGVVFTLSTECTPQPHQCPDCPPCIERDGYICERLGATDHNAVDPPECLPNICEMAPEPCATAPCDWLYSASTGVSLACVCVAETRAAETHATHCGPGFEFCSVDPQVCHHREYVYRNPLLFELIQGCDKHLARVESLSIEDWLQDSWNHPIQWRAFSSRIKQDGISIGFSKPIATNTLNPGSLFITAVVREQNPMFKDVLRLPISEIHFLDQHGDYAKGVRLQFSDLWIANQIDSELSRFNFPFSIELTVRGAHLRDECGDMLDARPLHFPENKKAQDMPGDDFVVTFCVEPKTISSSKPGSHDDDPDRADDQYPDYDKKPNGSSDKQTHENKSKKFD
ncbi:MAG: hypothetical protein V3T17_02370 [Pseudomonadales bacterium]